jgi:hypothetical protein
MLNQWGGIENMAYIQMDGERLFGKPESDQERSEPDGRTASVHFVRFSLSPAQIKQFTEPNHQIILGFDHPLYGHMTVLNQETKQELSKDFQN